MNLCLKRFKMSAYVCLCTEYTLKTYPSEFNSEEKNDDLNFVQNHIILLYTD